MFVTVILPSTLEPFRCIRQHGFADPLGQRKASAYLPKCASFKREHKASMNRQRAPYIERAHG